MLHDPDQVVDALSAFRRGILAALDRPDSATGLARQLGSTRQKVNYHLRALEDVGLVEVEELRQRRGLTERVMRRTSDVVLVDPTAFDTSGLSRTDVVGVSGVVTTATDLIGQAAQVASRAGNRGERVVAATLDTEIRVASPSALKAMLDEIAAVVARHDSGADGLRVRVATAVLPATEEG
jgi:DNA-binding transcriptional ArsR family regulator